MNHVGKKVNLISKSMLRYEGLLSSQTSEKLVLENVRLHGTEDRSQSLMIPPRTEIYPYIVFKPSDIVSIKPVVENQFSDPAIISTSTSHSSYNASLSSKFTAQPFVPSTYPKSPYGSKLKSPPAEPQYPGFSRTTSFNVYGNELSSKPSNSAGIYSPIFDPSENDNDYENEPNFLPSVSNTYVSEASNKKETTTVEPKIRNYYTNSSSTSFENRNTVGRRNHQMNQSRNNARHNNPYRRINPREFDFERANARFDKDEMINHIENEQKEQVVHSGYDKSVSFFDEISNEQDEKPSKNKYNDRETFGNIRPNDNRYGGRRRGKGRRPRYY